MATIDISRSLVRLRLRGSLFFGGLSVSLATCKGYDSSCSKVTRDRVWPCCQSLRQGGHIEEPGTRLSRV